MNPQLTELKIILAIAEDDRWAESMLRETVNECQREGSKEVAAVWYFWKMLKTATFKNYSQTGIKKQLPYNPRKYTLAYVCVCIHIYTLLWNKCISIFILQGTLRIWTKKQTETKEQIQICCLFVTSFSMWLIYITSNCHKFSFVCRK